MPLFSFLEFQDINFTSAEQRGDTEKLNPGAGPWLGAPTREGVGMAGKVAERRACEPRVHGLRSRRPGDGAQVTGSLLWASVIR